MCEGGNGTGLAKPARGGKRSSTMILAAALFFLDTESLHTTVVLSFPLRSESAHLSSSEGCHFAVACIALAFCGKAWGRAVVATASAPPTVPSHRQHIVKPYHPLIPRLRALKQTRNLNPQPQNPTPLETLERKSQLAGHRSQGPHSLRQVVEASLGFKNSGLGF